MPHIDRPDLVIEELEEEVLELRSANDRLESYIEELEEELFYYIVSRVKAGLPISTIQSRLLRMEAHLDIKNLDKESLDTEELNKVLLKAALERRERVGL